MASENVASLPDTFAGNCEHHGDFTGSVSVIFGKTFRTGCPKCAEIRKAKEAQDEIEAQARQERDRIQKKLGAAMIPQRFIGKTFAEYKADSEAQKKALSVCQDYAQNFRAHFDAGRCLLLLGKPGTGKTHLAAAIANQLVTTTAATAIYRTVGGILQHIKGSFDRESGYSEKDAFDSYAKAHLLIIDEVGATKPTEFELATLFQIINARYEELMPTVIISNLPPKALPEALGERCVDRLREGGGIALTFDWQSARKVAP